MKVKLIAPSSKAPDMINIIERAYEFYKEEGLDLIWPKDIFDSEELPFFAANKKIIQRELIESFTSKEYDVIWAVRGGYGSANFLDILSNVKIDLKKILIGFSDITAIHILLNQYFSMPSIHGPVLNSFFKNKRKFSLFKDLLKTKSTSYELFNINTINSPILSAQINGGNLSVISSMMGTKFTPNFDNKIILLEDVNEKGYQIHRFLMQLKNARIFDRAKALLIADFTQTDDIAELAINHFCNNEINIPAFRIKNIGHDEINKPIIFGSNAYIKGGLLDIDNPWFEAYSGSKY